MELRPFSPLILCLHLEPEAVELLRPPRDRDLAPLLFQHLITTEGVLQDDLALLQSTAVLFLVPPELPIEALVLRRAKRATGTVKLVEKG